MHINDACFAPLIDELAHFVQLRLRRRRQIQNWHVAVANCAKRLRFGKLGAKVEHGSHARLQRALCHAATKLAANPNARRNLIPGSTLLPIMEQRQILTDQTRTQDEFRTPGQPAPSFAENPRPNSKICRRQDAESEARPKKRRAPGPESWDQSQNDHGARRIIESKPAIRDYWQSCRGFMEKIEAITGQCEPTEDVDEVMLISQRRRQTDQCQPNHRAGEQNATKTACIKIDKKKPERGVQ